MRSFEKRLQQRLGRNQKTITYWGVAHYVMFVLIFVAVTTATVCFLVWLDGNNPVDVFIDMVNRDTGNHSPTGPSKGKL